MFHQVMLKCISEKLQEATGYLHNFRVFLPKTHYCMMVLTDVPKLFDLPVCKRWRLIHLPLVGLNDSLLINRVSVQFSSVAQLCPTLCDPMDCSIPGFPVHHQLPELAQTHVHRVGDAIQPFHPLSSPSSPTFSLSQHQGLSNKSVFRIRLPKYWSFSFSISTSNEYSGLISFRMYWFDLFAVQGTLQSLLQHHSSKASILRCSVFFIVQLSHPYMTTGKTIEYKKGTK